jgi:hypothetical protein
MLFVNEQRPFFALLLYQYRKRVNNLGNYTIAVLYCDKTRYRSKVYFLALTDKDPVLDEVHVQQIIQS